MADGSALIKLVELAKGTKGLEKLSERAQEELYFLLECDEPTEDETTDRLRRALDDHFRLDSDYPQSHASGWFILAELVQPNGDTRLSTRHSGSLAMPWNRIGALQYITNREMQRNMGGE